MYNYCTLYNSFVSTLRIPPHRGAGQRAGLSRQTVLAVARHIADAEGVDRLTMRRLAGELGVMPNALYSYFPHKEALLDALLDDLLGDIDPGDPGEGDWQDGLIRVMDSSRRLLLAHPRLVQVFLARPGLGPNAAKLGEITFALLRRGGLEGERAVEAFRVLLIYSLGFAAFQAPRGDDLRRPSRGQLPRDAPGSRRARRAFDRPALPHRTAVAARWHRRAKAELTGLVVNAPSASNHGLQRVAGVGHHTTYAAATTCAPRARTRPTRHAIAVGQLPRQEPWRAQGSTHFPGWIQMAGERLGDSRRVAAPACWTFCAS
jgi:TetR/AcrR family tetracycline transcriptional repressor